MGLSYGKGLSNPFALSEAAAVAATAAASAGQVFAVEFDGLSTGIIVGSAAASGAVANTAKSLWSYWVNWDGDLTDNDVPKIWSMGSSQGVFATAAQGIFEHRFELENASNTVTLRHDTSVHVTPDQWHHMLASVNLTGTHSALSGDLQFYMNDASAGSFPTVPASTETAFKFTDYLRIGMDETGNDKFAGKIANLVVYATAPDLAVTANRRHFISSAGSAVGVGASGTTPDLGDPWYYFNAGVSAWHMNKGEVTDANTTFIGSFTSAAPPTIASAA